MSYFFELELIRYIQEFRTPTLDCFFKLLNFFDTQEFLFVLIPAVWLGKGWKWGSRLFYILLLSTFANQVLKAFLVAPRPFHVDPTVGIIQVSGYGFPSGAAQTVLLLSGLLWKNWRSSWKKMVIFFYVVFVSFSRVYLGVHFPTDILGGWVVGSALFTFFIYVVPRIESKIEKLKLFPLFLLSQAIPLMLIFLQYSPNVVHMSICAMGIGFGLIINAYFKWSITPCRNTREFALRVTIGIAGTFLGYFLLSLLPILQSVFFIFFVLGLWITTGSLLLCRRLFSLNSITMR